MHQIHSKRPAVSRGRPRLPFTVCMNCCLCCSNRSYLHPEPLLRAVSWERHTRTQIHDPQMGSLMGPQSIARDRPCWFPMAVDTLVEKQHWGHKQAGETGAFHTAPVCRRSSRGKGCGSLGRTVPAVVYSEATARRLANGILRMRLESGERPICRPTTDDRSVLSTTLHKAVMHCY